MRRNIETNTSLKKLIHQKLSQKKIGASFEYNVYRTSEGIQLPDVYSEINHPEFTQTLAQLKIITNICEQIGKNILCLFPRDNGPENVNTHFGHGFRTANIIINEFGVIDPMVIATSYLHDLYQVVINTISTQNLSQVQKRTIAREHVKNIIDQYFDIELPNFPNNTFQIQLLSNLEDLFVLEHDYKILAEKIIDQEDVLLPILNNHQITPQEFLSIREKIINTYVNSHSAVGKFMNLEEIFRYSLDQLQQTNTLGLNTVTQNSSGVAVILSLIAEAVDNQRYPANTANQKSELKRAIISHFFLIVMARTFDLPTAVRDLGEQVNNTFFGPIWKSFKEALSKIGDQHLKDWFIVQQRMSGLWLHKELHQLFETNNLKTLFVSAEEFELRKIHSELNPDDDYLDDWEYTISTDIKTSASIFAKWVVNQANNQLSDGLTQLDFNSADAQTYWQEYLSGAPDILRANVVMGKKLSQAILNTNIIENFTDNLQYVDEPNSNKQTNYFRSTRKHHSNREDAESWRVKPLLEDENIFFEYHLCLLLTNPETSEKRLIPFEIHFESVAQWYQDTLGSQIHQLYKDKDLIPDLPSTWQEHHRMYLVGLYQMIQKELQQVYYNGLATLDPIQTHENLLSPTVGSLYHGSD